ncbi:hypothetical protein [Arthrobacter sp. B10-11]|uniref:hypothetical protein n=1 Tax=Arthrobacter sp. B10-11 TaxID=3081160 RepID=UPI002953C85C|nr:hypothetical protein [Arthrobacter sp. B10-11]MDV8149126.1 hypothetical protein [Arthrobacter sp. B10-11]
MGATLCGRCRTAVRAFLLAALVAVTWLVLAAGPASAAADKPNPLGTVAQAADSLLQKTVNETVPQVGSIADPAVQDAPVPVAAVPPLAGTAATVADVVDGVTTAPVLGGTAGAVTGTVDGAAPLLTDTITDTVTDTPLLETVTDAVTGAVDGVVSVVDSLAPVLPVISVPTVPVPSIPQPEIPRPEVPVKAPEKALPARPSATVAPSSGVHTQPVSAALGVEAPFFADTARPAEVTAAPQQASRPVSPLEFLANTQAVRALAATIGYVVSAAPAPQSEPGAALTFPGLQNQTGPSSAGAGSAGAEAGDVDSFWNQLHDAGRFLVPDAALVLTAGPAFDPGSSPD